MRTELKNSRKWLYTYIGIGIAALITGVANLYYEQYLTAVAMVLILLAQISNIIKWRKLQK